MLVEFTKEKEGTRYLMAKKNLKKAVQLHDRNLEVLSLQSMASENTEVTYLVVYHSKCFRQLAILEELVTRPFAAQMEETIIPYVCSKIKSNRAAGKPWPSVVVVFEGNVYSVPCSATGRFPSEQDIKEFALQNPEPICAVAE